MSAVMCGNCRKPIYGEFGILYKLHRTKTGRLAYPGKSMVYIPPNSAVCDDCWRRVPDYLKIPENDGRAKMERSRSDVFAYARADAREIISGTIDKNLVFVSFDSILRYLPKALQIIEAIEDRRAMTARRRNR